MSGGPQKQWWGKVLPKGRDLSNTPSHQLGVEVEMTWAKNINIPLGIQMAWLAIQGWGETRLEEQRTEKQSMKKTKHEGVFIGVDSMYTNFSVSHQDLPESTIT